MTMYWIFPRRYVSKPDPLGLIFFIFAVIVTPAYLRAAETESKQIPAHLLAFEEAEKINAQEVAQKNAIEWKRISHQAEIKEKRDRIQKLPVTARQEVIKRFARSFIEVLDQLEANSHEGNQGAVYRALPSEARERLYQRGLEILEVVPSDGILETGSFHFFLGSLAVGTALLGAVSQGYISGGGEGWGGASGAFFLIASGFPLQSTFETWRSNAIWSPFWDEISQHYQTQLPKRLKKRALWLTEKLLAAYQPELKVRVADTSVKAEAKLECQRLLTRDTLAGEVNEETPTEDAVRTNTRKAYL